VLSLHARGLPFSISAAVGFFALSGVSVLGDMVLVSRGHALLVLPVLDSVLGAARDTSAPADVMASLPDPL